MDTTVFAAALEATRAFVASREAASTLAERITIPPARGVRRDLDAAQSSPSRATVCDLCRSLYAWCEHFEPPVSATRARAYAEEDRRAVDALKAMGRAARDACRRALHDSCAGWYVEHGGVFAAVEDVPPGDLEQLFGRPLYRHGDDYTVTDYRLGDGGRPVHQSEWD